MTIAVTGSTGQLGRLVIAALKQKLAPSNIVALARSTAKAADLGVTVREADYGSVATIETALQGVDTLLLISSSELGQRHDVRRRKLLFQRGNDEAAKLAGRSCDCDGHLFILSVSMTRM